MLKFSWKTTILNDFNYFDSFQRHKNLIIWSSVQLTKISPLINFVNVALVLNLESYCVGKYSTKEDALRKKPHNCLCTEQPNRTGTFNNTFFERAPSVTSCALCSTTKGHKREDKKNRATKKWKEKQRKNLCKIVFFYFSELRRILKLHLLRFLFYKRMPMYLFSNAIVISENVKLCSQSGKFTVTDVLEKLC